MSPVSEISPYLYLDVFIWRGQAGSVPEISVSGLGILPYGSSGLLAG